jgi:hypothetical protein
MVNLKTIIIVSSGINLENQFKINIILKGDIEG